MRLASLSSFALALQLAPAVAGAGLAPCVGDCDGDGQISIAELVRGVGIALGAPLDRCPGFDRSGNGSVGIDELIAAVGGALNGCQPAVAAGAAPAAGSLAVANALNALPELVTALASGADFGGEAEGARSAGSPDDGATVAGACPLGGTSKRRCRDSPALVTTITLSSCAIAAGSGSLTAQGSIGLRGAGFCGAFVPSSAGVSVDSTLRDAGGAVVRTTSARLAGSIAARLDASCFVSGVRLVVTGTLETEDASGAGVSIAFDDTTIDLDVTAFGANCLPLMATLTLNGPAVITDRASRVPLRVSFENFVLSREVPEGGT